MSNYVEKNLNKDEKIVLTAEKNSIILGIETGVLFLIVIITGFIQLWYTIVVLFAFSIIIGIQGAIFNNIEFSVTNKRVVGKMGIFNTHVMSAPLNKIQSVYVYSSWLGKILNIGTIVIVTSSSKFRFRYIKNINIFLSSIMNKIEEYEQSCIKEQAEQVAIALGKKTPEKL